MELVKYSFGYMFKYSERPGTPAAKKLEDNIDEKTKSRRLSEIVELQQKHSLYRSKEFIGKTVEVLIEKESKKSNLHWAGRTDSNEWVIVEKNNSNIKDIVPVEIVDATGVILHGKEITGA